MWPFNNKKKDPEPDPYFLKQTEIYLRVKKIFPVGKEFSYLGRRMIVIQLIYPYQSFLGPSVSGIRCNYCDNNGVIRMAEFSLDEIEALCNLEEQEGKDA